MKKVRKVFKELLPPDVALKRLEERVPPAPPEPEEVLIEDALGHYLAEDITSPINLPPYARSSADGYAVKARSTWGAQEDRPVELKVVGEVRVGEEPAVEVGPGEAVEVDTGSAIPPGADAVVMIEYVKELDGKILVYKAVVPGENVLWPATDVYVGQPLWKAGTRVDSRVIASLAAVGIRKVKVWRPKVYLISTGGELVEPGRPLKVGKIYDVNSYSLKARLEEEGFVPILHGVVPDDPEELRKAILRGVEVADVVVTTGSTSAGPGDYVYRVVGELGEVLVHGLAFKPGKPVMLGVVKGKPVFGLAGHPDSAYFNLERLVIPYLKKMVRSTSPEGSKVVARAAASFVGARGRRTHVPVVLLEDASKRFYAFPSALADHAMVSYSRADGYIVIPETRRAPVEVDEEVEVYLFKDPSYGFAVVGDTDVWVDDAVAEFATPPKMLPLGSYSGSYASSKNLRAVWISPDSKGEEVEVDVVVVGKGDRLGVPHKASFLYHFYLKWLRDLGLTKGEAQKRYVHVVMPTPQALAAGVKEGQIDMAITTKSAAERFGLEWRALGRAKLFVGWGEGQEELGRMVLDAAKGRR
ncbi:MAG: molybdopterin biosynthesis protein [Crenarchaeota archaeon]|nr:molybdopterin biosynthesis protein [Thermoproteota archaeon]